ncbi:MAG TPA: PAS domain S-box protein [Candidatus Saccharicenans sp.]|nr:PAS domain S-box protein [Candidatus Saccharicenans sp.]
MKVIKRQREKSQKAAEYFAPTVNSFQNLWENLPVACHILTPEGIITHVNQTEARMLGYKKEEMVGKSIFDFVLPEQRLVAKKRFQQKLAGRRLPRARDRIYVRKDGSKLNVIINDRIKWDSQKKPICVFGTLVNITNYKKVEDLNQEMMKNMRNW